MTYPFLNSARRQGGEFGFYLLVKSPAGRRHGCVDATPVFLAASRRTTVGQNSVLGRDQCGFADANSPAGESEIHVSAQRAARQGGSKNNSEGSLKASDGVSVQCAQQV